MYMEIRRSSHFTSLRDVEGGDNMIAAHLPQVSKHFSSSMGVDDFIARLEIALFAYGFTGDNSIGVAPGSPVKSGL